MDREGYMFGSFRVFIVRYKKRGYFDWEDSSLSILVLGKSVYRYTIS